MNRLGRLTIKLVDIMIGVVLGLGFQWWPSLHEPWQYVAFIFVYFDLVDYWIDYSTSLKRLPPRRELTILLDIAVIFTMFLYIYATQLSILEFLAAFIAFKVVDTFCLIRARVEHHPSKHDRHFVRAWIWSNLFEVVGTGALIAWTYHEPLTAPIMLGIFIALRLATRVWASLQYKEVYFS